MPRVTKIGLVPVSQPGEAVRRYRLARLEDVSLATPAEGLDARRNGKSAEHEQAIPQDASLRQGLGRQAEQG
jgi:hypothetical protein